jgi:hypothetical protein
MRLGHAAATDPNRCNTGSRREKERNGTPGKKTEETQVKTTKKTGDDAEKMAVSVLESQGYVAQRAWPRRVPVGPGKWIAMEQDFFGCWDVIALRANSKPLYIQVTAKEGAWQEKLRKIKANEPNGGWPTEHADFEVWASKRRAMAECSTRQEYLSWQHFDVKRLLADGTLSPPMQVPFVRAEKTGEVAGVKEPETPAPGGNAEVAAGGERA